jgi:hypothetical protein
VLRLRGHYLAVATLGLIIVLRVVINNANGLTRGALGLNGIPRLTSLWVILGWLAVTLVVCWRLKHSSVGRSLMALRENEMAAACMGVSRARSRLIAFALGAFFAGVGGALWAHLLTNLTPGSFNLALAFMLVVMVVIGGSGSLVGADPRRRRDHGAARGAAAGRAGGRRLRPRPDRHRPRADRHAAAASAGVLRQRRAAHPAARPCRLLKSGNSDRRNRPAVLRRKHTTGG